MKILSFYEDHGQVLPLEVEVELSPGLSEFHFSGGADPLIKESSRRIKNAIRAQGFTFSAHQQVLVNLRPSYFKKYSRGLDLAIALGYLAVSGQLPAEWLSLLKQAYVYGELSLSGEIIAPMPFPFLWPFRKSVVITGPRESAGINPQLMLSSLADFRQSSVTILPPYDQEPRWSPSEEVLEYELSELWATRLAVAALGNHSMLLAGLSGAGKTTAAKILNALLPEPDETLSGELLSHQYRRDPEGFLRIIQKDTSLWRPLIAPHHTIPLASLIGGGFQAHGGDLARAHGGTLLLDEFFEFHPHTREALREPLEQKKLRVTRGMREKVYPLDCQVVATTNLCPCGKWIPGQSMNMSCRFSLKRCQSYREKISGPLLDRFEMVLLVKERLNTKPRLRVKDLRDQLSNRRMDHREIEIPKHLLSWVDSEPQLAGISSRRKKAILAVALSLARWEEASEVKLSHLNQAITWCWEDFRKIQQWES